MYRFLCPILFLLTLLGCTTHPIQLTFVEEEPDLTCSYFYFLWGTHAEYGEQYPEALEAYEKALICDPQAQYIKEKLPVLLLKMGESEMAISWLNQAIANDPENNGYRLFLANLYIQQKKVDQAITLYNDALQREPQNETVQIRLGLLYSHLEEYPTAESIFRKLLEKNKDSYFARLSLARVLKQQNKFSDALSEYEKALTLNWSKELAYELGYIYVDQQKFSDALRIYTTITDNDRFDEQASLSRIQALLDLERYEEAMNALQTTRNFSEDPNRIDLIVSKLLLQQKKTDQAKDILKRLSLEMDSSEPRYMLALLAYQENRFTDSLHQLSAIRPEDADFEEGVYLQTRIYRKLEDTDQAIALLKHYLAQPEYRSPLFYALLSSFYQDMGDIEQGLNTLDEATGVYPDNQQIFFEYGLLLEKAGKHSKAVTKMQRVLELEPNHPEALNFIGYTWADQNIKLDQALDYIERALAQRPDNGFIIDSLGWVYFRLGKLQLSVETLQRSLELEPDDPHIYDHLGDVYTTQKKYDKAIEMYKEALERFKDGDKKDAVMEKLEQLSTDHQ